MTSKQTLVYLRSLFRSPSYRGKWTNEKKVHIFLHSQIVPRCFISMMTWLICLCATTKDSRVFVGPNSKHAMGWGVFVPTAFDTSLSSGKSKYVHVDIIWVNEVTLIASEMTRRCQWCVCISNLTTEFPQKFGHTKRLVLSWERLDRTRVRQTGNDYEFRQYEKNKGLFVALRKSSLKWH